MANEFPDEPRALNYAVYQSNIAVAKEGSNPGDLKLASGLAVDVTNQNSVIADSGNARIQIFSHEGVLVSVLGQFILKHPWGVSVNKSYIYVTDIQLHTVFRFRKSDLTLITAAGKKGDLEEEFNFPGQPGTSHSGFLYVPDRYNNRVQILCPEFRFLQPIKNDVLYQPVDIKVTLSVMYILCSPEKPCIHILKHKEDNVKTIQFHSHVQTAFFFCIDQYRNFVISDYGEGILKVLRDSKVIFRIAEGKIKESGEGALVCPCGVCFSGGKIVSVSHNPKFGLQIYSPPPLPLRFMPD